MPVQRLGRLGKQTLQPVMHLRLIYRRTIGRRALQQLRCHAALIVPVAAQIKQRRRPIEQYQWLTQIGHIALCADHSDDGAAPQRLQPRWQLAGQSLPK